MRKCSASSASATWELDDFPEHNKKPYSAIDPGVRERLEERFAEPNARLAKLLGWQPAWLDLDGAETLAEDGSLVRRQNDG